MSIFGDHQKKVGLFRVAIFGAAVCALLTIFSACNFRVVRDPKILVQNLDADPSTLNPLVATDAVAFAVLRNVYESLLERDNETLELKPRLASSWTVSPDHLTYTFTIRDGVRWHDGVLFTADDVIYSFERIRDPKVDAASLRSYFKDVISVKKLDEKTVRFTYSRPYFKALEICGGIPIVPKHVFDDGTVFNTHAANRKPIGTGPYRFVSWETGRLINIEENPDYWDKKPRIVGIVFRVIPNSTVVFQLLKKGDLDLAGLRAIQWERQTEMPSFSKRFDKYRYWLPNYSYIGWNLRKPFFQDRRVRIAMTMMLNRASILKELLFGQGDLVSGNFYRFGKNYDEKIEPYPFDPAKAASLLDQAGWIDHDGDGIRDKDGVPFRFTYLVAAGSRMGQNIGLMLRENLLRAGIEMDVRSLEWAAMLKSIASRDFDAVMLAWSTSIDEEPYQLWHSTQAAQGSNFIGFQNPEADRLIEKARVEFDPARRAVMYKKLHSLIHYEEPYTFLFISPSLVAVAKRFTDVKAYKVGLDMTEWGVKPWATLKEW